MSNPSEKAMVYIRLQLALIDHPKFADLIDYLEDKREKFVMPTVLGCLALLWMKAARHFTDGQIRDDHDVVRRIAKVSQWPGDSKVWVEGLEHVHFLDRNDEGYYLHNWMERHAREWWLKQEDHERVKRLARDRAARFRAKLRAARDEAKVLREKFGSSYDASPPPDDARNADLAFVTRDVTLGDVTSRASREGVRDASFVPISDAAETGAEPAPADSVQTGDNGKALSDNGVRENSVSHALANVTSRASRCNRVDESRVERDKDKDGTELAREANGAPLPAESSPIPEPPTPNHQSCIDLWYQLHQARFNEPFGNGGFLARIVAKRSKQGYPELELRIRNWWASTYHKIAERRFAPSDFDRRWSELKDGPLAEWERTKSRRPADGEDFRKPNPERDSGFGQPDNA